MAATPSLSAQRKADLLSGACVGAAASAALLLANRWLWAAAEPEPEQQPPPQPSETLQLVLVLHRHGARYPNKAMPCDLNWPADAGFWSCHSAEQSADGTLQMHDLGRKLRARYGSWLRDGVPPQQVRDTVRALSTNTQRTLNSAWALLGALFPGTPRYIRFPADRPGVDWESLERRLAAAAAAESAGAGTMGVAILVEPDGPLFHQLKTAPIEGYDRNHNCCSCPEVQAMAKDPAVLALADTLHEVTGAKGLAPAQPAVQRVASLKSLATQLEINSSHGMANLPGTHPATPLPASAVSLVERAGRAVWSRWYRPPHAKAGVEDGVGAAAAGNLGRAIAQFLQERKQRGGGSASAAGEAAAAGTHDSAAAGSVTHTTRPAKDAPLGLRFVEMSAHDGNLLALASRLGVDITPPRFAAHWLFELHRCSVGSASTAQEEWTVRVFYVSDPTQLTEQQFCQLVPRRLPLDGRYVAYSACREDHSACGLTLAEELIGYLGAAAS
jgi:hypothetical protein